jgi:glutaredoxin
MGKLNVMIEVYSKDFCPFCKDAKALIESKGYEYTEIKIGRDISREEFLEKFPGVRTVPQVIINGIRIGGYDAIQEHTHFK